MGIRVHKVLGYGLTDVQVDGDDRLADPRIDAASPLLKPWSIPLADYRAWLDERYAERDPERLNLDQLMLKDEGRDYQMQDALVYQSEYGLANVLLLKPISCEDWQRHDSPIDFIEETYLCGEREPQAAHVSVLEDGIFPYSDSWMDRRSGQRLPKEARLWLWARGHNRRDDRGRAIEASALDEMAKQAGFSDHAEATLNVVPRVPDEVRDLAEFGHLFTADDVWRELRPLLYVFWA